MAAWTLSATWQFARFPTAAQPRSTGGHPGIAADKLRCTFAAAGRQVIVLKNATRHRSCSRDRTGRHCVRSHADLGVSSHASDDTRDALLSGTVMTRCRSR
ncbi:hypothetical protein ACFC8N_45430 [Streptomyces sp. NPDC055966]|uniref:hypothetical protein n=1 Tax=unclassified Streptomyces TaxID=2593676 RepID=UPI0035E01DF0